ncbi:hypothetical protein QQS21_003603 [Conoideocrella luteorostrata]|uniref:Uncharacterized protein n=1 Tax=Conoideocrella luteorostrata TaxID=1105319 RepID=A0AAJ0CSY1_9HYPO|nr:hypothetical protein QQS21_003603 [Conoideocrella luteorostrata]
MFFKPVEKNSAADYLQLIDSAKPHVKGSDSDALAEVTPKDVLLRVASLCAGKGKCNIYDKISECPYNDKSQFTACLCAGGLTIEDVKCLQGCLRSLDRFLFDSSWTIPFWNCHAEGYFKNLPLPTGTPSPTTYSFRPATMDKLFQPSATFSMPTNPPAGFKSTTYATSTSDGPNIGSGWEILVAIVGVSLVFLFS